MFDRKKYKWEAYEKSQGLPKKMVRVSLARVLVLVLLYAAVYFPYYVKKHSDWKKNWKETVMNAQGTWNGFGDLHEFQAGEEIDYDNIQMVYSYGEDGSLSVKQRLSYWEYVKDSRSVLEETVIYLVGWALFFVFTAMSFAVSRYVFNWRKRGESSFASFLKSFSGRTFRGAAWYSLWNFIFSIPMQTASILFSKLLSDERAAASSVPTVASGLASAAGEAATVSPRVGIAMLVIYLMLFYVIFAYAKVMGYSMMRYVLADNPKLGVCCAMNLSKKMCKGCRENILVMQLSFFLWWIFSIITLGFGFILLMPYLENSYINAYEAIKKNSIESGVLKEEDFDVLQ